MNSSIEQLQKQFLQEIDLVKTTHHLEAIKVKYLGKKGPVQDLMKVLRDVEPSQRQSMGKQINDLKELMIVKCTALEKELIASEEEQKLQNEQIDITLPGKMSDVGRKHPLTQALDRIIHILSGMGFSVQYGPDVDTDYYNFEALNFPLEHPARDMQDTFYITPHILLRTHTSNIQARVMEQHRPPIRIIAPGRAFRNEAITARSHVFFHQVEAVFIDRNVSFADLFTTMEDFLVKLFDRQIKIRFRPSFFPFVEPGLEVDIACLACHGTGCGLCKHSGWLEIAGAGMIHPEVLKNGNIDPEEYSGFAWGMGLERLVILLRGIKDIRQFTENDLRFLVQFTTL